MDDSGRLRRLGAARDGPGLGFLGAGGEIGDQPQKFVALADEAVEAGLVQPEAFEIFGLFLGIAAAIAITAGAYLDLKESGVGMPTADDFRRFTGGDDTPPPPPPG